jgi:hypothetical protein
MLELPSHKAQPSTDTSDSLNHVYASTDTQYIALLPLYIPYTCNRKADTEHSFHHHKIPLRMNKKVPLMTLASIRSHMSCSCSKMNTSCMSNDISRKLTHCYQSNPSCTRIGCLSSLCNSHLNMTCSLLGIPCMKGSCMRMARMLHSICHRKIFESDMRMLTRQLDSSLGNSLCMKAGFSKSHMSNRISCMSTKYPVRHGTQRRTDTSCFRPDFCLYLADKQCMLSCLYIQSMLASMNRR